MQDTSSEVYPRDSTPSQDQKGNRRHTPSDPAFSPGFQWFFMTHDDAHEKRATGCVPVGSGAGRFGGGTPIDGERSGCYLVPDP